MDRNDDPMHYILMDTQIKENFLDRWNKYFGSAELPIICFYSNDCGGAEPAAPSRGWSCLIRELARVRKGASLCFDETGLGCDGAKRYLGFTDRIRPNFEYFLSCGIPGELEGERYIRTPEMVLELQKNQKHLPITGTWDKVRKRINKDQP